MDYNKKGLSPVIATVLIIMITIASIAILAGFLVPFVKNSLQRGSECLSYKEYYLFDESFGYNCNDGSTYKISIGASFDETLAENIEGMKIVLNEKGGTSKVLDIKNNSESSISEGGISLVGDSQNNLRIPSPGGIVTYAYQAPIEDNFVSAEVYPILKSGRICADQKESINIKPC
ncbi:MAG TPA: archaellin/type IV pilin N-terminal domain-containing protein [Candidatus Nanoarchaeia archaeon]|nr:archaellin/type IV pilin N-terminal domain-containing protein [Candidatus Nanoarchaeia archaeon]